MIHGHISGPRLNASLCHLKRWSNASKHPETTPSLVTYSEAMSAFDADRLLLQSRDRDASNPSTKYEADVDLRPGEVELPHLGSLHSTPEGFSIRILNNKRYFFEQGMPVMDSTGRAGRPSPDAGSHSYSVNFAKGTIEVINTTDTISGSWFRPDYPGTVERYTIDTVNGTIADYSKVTRDTPQPRKAF